MGYSYRSEPEPKDFMRVDDIMLKKAVDDVDKQEKLAKQQAKLITDPYKALRRGRAALNRKYYKLCEVFYTRVKEIEKTDEIKQGLLSEEDEQAMNATIADITLALELGIFF